MASTIRRALRSFPTIILTDPRQSGKTTLLREQFGKSFGYASLEDPVVRLASLADPQAFLEKHSRPCINR